MTYAVQFLMGKTHPRSFVNELFFVVGITIAWVALVVLALTRMTGIVFVVFVVCGLGPLWDARCTDERTEDRPRVRNTMTWLLCLSVGEYLVFYSLHVDYGHEVPYFGVMPILMVALTLYTIFSVHRDHVQSFRRVAPQIVVSPQVEPAVERVATPAVPVQQQPRPAPAQRTIQPKSWNDLANEVWNFQPLQEQFRLLIEGVQSTVWPDENKEPSDVFFKGFIGDIKRLQLPKPKDLDSLSGTFIWVAQQLLEQHKEQPFANLDEFLDAREALLTSSFPK